jgi:hypothetical protein
MPLLRSLGLLALLSGAGSCGSGVTEPDPGRTLRILFIGNSLTYFNDLPGMVRALADSAGMEPTHVEMVAEPNFALEDHWTAGEAVRRIRRGGWRFVVMQQGPSALESSRTNLLEWVPRFDTEIRAVGATPIMYMVWPSTDRSFDFPRVSETYRLAAEAINGRLAPAGDAWLAAWGRSATLPLYGSDGFHPSIMGTYLAALTIFGAVYERSAVGLPARLATPALSFQVPSAEAALLQAAADEANGR